MTITKDTVELLTQWLEHNKGTKETPLKSNSVKSTHNFLNLIDYTIIGQRFYTNSNMTTKLDILKVRDNDTGKHDIFYVEYDKTERNGKS